MGIASWVRRPDSRPGSSCCTPIKLWGACSRWRPSSRVHIHCCGNGYLGFRPYGGSLLEEPGAGPAKSNQKRFAPPLGTSLSSVCPHSGIAPWARRDGPSMALRGYPGIHAGMPTPQCLRSAIVVNGALRSKAGPRRPYSRPGSCGRAPFKSVGAKLAREAAW